RIRNIRGDFSLKCLQDELLKPIGFMSPKSLLSVLRKLLRLETDVDVELYFETLAGVRVDPLAVDSPVLIFRPEIPEFVQLKALLFETSDVSPDTSSALTLPVLKGVPDRIGN